MAETCRKLDPNNGGVIDLVKQLKGGADVTRLEEEVRQNPTNFQKAFELASFYFRMQQKEKGMAILDDVAANPKADVQAVVAVVQTYMRLNDYPKVEKPMERLVELAPDEPEPLYDLASLRMSLGKSSEAMAAIQRAVEASRRRSARNPAAPDVRSTIAKDPRFAPLHELPEWKALFTEKPQ